jgi:hypothetical protein
MLVHIKEISKKYIFVCVPDHVIKLNTSLYNHFIILVDSLRKTSLHDDDFLNSACKIGVLSNTHLHLHVYASCLRIVGNPLITIDDQNDKMIPV